MIYFIESDAGPIKIGYTESSATERREELQTGSAWPLSLLGTIEGDRETEAMLHHKFAAQRMQGEWFRGSVRRRVLALILEPLAEREAPRPKIRPRPASARLLSAETPPNGGADATDAVPDAPLVAPIEAEAPAVALESFSIEPPDEPQESAWMNVCVPCGKDFGSVSAFDAHRVGTHAYTYSEGVKMEPMREDGRRCLSRAELVESGFVQNTHGRWSLSTLLSDDAIAA